MRDVLIITDIGSNMDDIFAFAYLRTLCESINIVGMITSGGESRMRRMILRAYLKLFDYPNWSKIKIYYTTQENDDEYYDTDIVIKNRMYSLLNTNNKSFFDLENEFNGIDYENECEFIESIQENKIDVICLGPITPLYNAMLKNENILKKISSIFFQGGLQTDNFQKGAEKENFQKGTEKENFQKGTEKENFQKGTEKEMITDNIFASIKDYYQNEVKIVTIGADIDNSYNFCGIWNLHNRQLVKKTSVETIIATVTVLKTLYEKTDAKMYFVGNCELGLTQENLEKMNYTFLNEDIYRIHEIQSKQPNYTNPHDFLCTLSDAMLIAYFDSIFVKTFIRDTLKMVLFEELYFKVRYLKHIKNNNTLISNLIDLCKKQENVVQKSILEKKSPWWRS